HVPHIGVSVNGARRWLGTGPLQFQPSELMKLALVLYAAALLARRPQRVHDLRELLNPLVVVVAPAVLLIGTQPDLATALGIAIGSGGLFGVGPGQSVQKIFYLPEAPTDFILAVIAEELGVVGVFALMFLYGLIAYAGLRTAKAARSLYSALIAVGVTSLIVS